MTAAAGTVPVEMEWPDCYAVPLVFAASGASSGLTGVASDVTGWSFRESTGNAAAVLQLVDGTSNTGLVFAEIALTPGQSIRDNTGPRPLRVFRGVWVQIVSGSVQGSVWAWPV